ncbi:tetratricopeptide repeat protein [Akkermansia sp.]|uniref:tetratricopeptide repeat protein n=1 Tax=Akkermansia sp. TaxID=1872421 RepID=UPI0025BD489B|nr:tetratricopeptide repeat protein [Akkermansia sp.]MCC8147765.1 sel1 repeat family protein [Akkermansia sp.]
MKTIVFHKNCYKKAGRTITKRKYFTQWNIMLLLGISSCPAFSQVPQPPSSAIPPTAEVRSTTEEDRLFFQKTLKKAQQENDAAQANLAICYLQGKGVEQNVKEAFQWYAKAAQQGDPSAQYSVAICYEKGYGVPRDLSRAKEWWEKAAAQGFKPAIQKLKEYSTH